MPPCSSGRPSGPDMREIVFDTETTGVDPERGDRVVEIGMVELEDLTPTGRTFHAYLNPDMAMPAEAARIHGLTDAFLADKPRFSDPDIHNGLLAFIGDAPLIAHNAEFDRRFLNAEFARVGLPSIPQERCIDTLLMARRKFPGSPNSLDALCRRYGIDLAQRDKHGALLDARLLADVYLELRGGRARTLDFADASADGGAKPDGASADAPGTAPARRRPDAMALLSTADERAAHAAFLAELGAPPVWDARAGGAS